MLWRGWVFSAILFLYLPLQDARAAAWLLEKGQKQLINNLFLYRTDKAFLANGDQQRQPEFTKLEYNPYLEYGWKDDVTLGLSTSLQRLSQKGNGDNSGLGDTEIFARKRLWQNERAVLSLQPLLKLPGLYDEDETLSLGQGQVDVEIRALGGMAFPLYGQWHYYNLEVAYRQRYGAPADEIRVNQSLGLKVADKWQAVLQNDNYFAVDGDANGTTLRLANSAGYDMVKLQVSVVHEWDKKTSLQLGAFQHVAGENTGAGSGLLASMWLKF